MTKSARAEPWQEPVTGPSYYLLVDEITVRAVAEGIVTARLQVQAYRLTHWLETAPDGLYAVVAGDKPPC